MKYVLPLVLCATITFNCWATEPVLDTNTRQSFINSGRVLMNSLQSKEEQELLSKAMVFYMMGAGNGWTTKATDSDAFREERFRELEGLSAPEVLDKYQHDVHVTESRNVTVR
ncbi:hypothetical protein [Marinomonas fungiae]|uniref:Uncharacterized protein n=1 Tax=Marinomonas fungiae TaxID=1137284 RepID=A0A0K6IU95_9GAMM|nr:hypothetical protein [Marinomonas fungiae]CUB06634.1 hypothetical protein Ga0061065_12018 [Marinomonas fungiae]